MAQHQVMLDLETMSTESNAAICSIGAVKFTADLGIVDTFNCFTYDTPRREVYRNILIPLFCIALVNRFNWNYPNCFHTLPHNTASGCDGLLYSNTAPFSPSSYTRVVMSLLGYRV